MDKRIKYRIVLDTETAPMDNTLEDVKPSNMLVYDIGWAVVDKRGNVYETASFINTDVFLDKKDLMQSAYYADKIPNYWEDVKAGQRKLAKLETIRKALADTCKKYNVTEIYAHNARFDYGSLNNTSRWETKSAKRYFLPYGTVVCDTLKMSRDVIGKMPTYRYFCEKHGYLTKRGQLRFTAEILYRFISGNIDFEESHTGLEDVMIEKEIMAYCFKQHKKMRKYLFEN